MRRLAASFMAAVFLLMLSPCAFAAEILPRPGEGQIVFVDADNDVDYRAAFPLSALKAASRSGDDLIIQLPTSRMMLKGFFSRLGEWRSVEFSDGKSLGGADFDADGNFTGLFSTTDSLERHSTAIRAASPVLTAEYTQYGIEVYDNGSAVHGEVKETCLELLKVLYPMERPDWQKIESMSFEFVQEPDGGLRPSRARVSFADGFTVRSVNPAAVCISDSLSLMPISVGRAVVSYENALGQELFSLGIRCDADAHNELSVSSVCSCCGETQGSELHYMACGHYRCQHGSENAEHSPAVCGIAGHCSSEGEHAKCKNCLGPMCDGQSHGFGQCLHTHNWVPVNMYTSRCIVCSAEYTRPA